MKKKITFYVYDFRKRYPLNVLERLTPHEECKWEEPKVKQVKDGYKYEIVIFKCFNCLDEICFWRKISKERMERLNKYLASKTIRWFDDRTEG